MIVIKSTKLMLLLPLLAMQAFSQNVVKIQSGGAINLQGNVVITLQNVDLDNDGNINPAANAGRFVFKGSANNVVRGNGTTNFDQLEIAKTGSGQLTIQTNTSTRGGIWLNGGNIIANDRVITLLGNAALNGESENSRVITTNDGYVQVSMQLNAPVSINPGNLGAIISSNQDMGLTTIRRGNQQQSLAAGRTSIQRYFDISPQYNTNLDATLRLHYTDAELDDQAEGAIEIYTSENLTTWIKKASSSRNTTLNYVQLEGINSFARLTLADDGVGLPVTFSLFTVDCRTNETIVSWATASEQNSSFYEVQRSANGTTWTTIASLPAAGNSNTEKRYSYADQQPQGKFYRIKEVDLDGSEQYSQVGVADCENGNYFKVWPNPVLDQLLVSIKADSRGNAVIKVYNVEGKLVKMQNNGLQAGRNQLAVDMRSLLAGYYHVEVTWADGMRKTLTVSKK